MPLGDVLVSNPTGDIEHDYGAVAANTWIKGLLVAFSESSEFLLSCGVPDVELDGAVVGVEDDGVDLHALGGDVLLLEFAGQVTLHEGRLPHAPVAHHHQLELSHRSHALNLLNVRFHERFGL